MHAAAHSRCVGPVVRPAPLPHALHRTLAARRPGNAHSRRGLPNVVRSEFQGGRSVDAEDYISYVLNSKSVLEDGPSEGGEEGRDPVGRDTVVQQAVSEVEEHLTHINRLNETLMGQLHNVTEGLESVIQSARARQAVEYGKGNGAPPAAAGAAQQQQQQQEGEDGAGLLARSPQDQPGAEHSSSLSCVVQHPGALCCTKTTATANPTAMTCSITMETSARFSLDDAVTGQLNMDDLQALAAQALVSAAAEHCRNRTQASQAHVHPSERLRQHTELVNILAHGNVVGAERNRPSQFGHESYIVQLEDPHTHRRVRAVFKPRIPGDADGWHRAPIEWVAYELNLLLGMDYVPPVAYRRGGVDIDLGEAEGGVVSHDEGAMMYWIENASQLKHYSPELWGARQEVLLSDTRILDVLLHNSDRHHGHFLLGRHWCEGSWQGHHWNGDLRPALIDHAAGFRRDAHVTMQHENAFQTGPVRCVSARTYLRLRFLDATTVSTKFADFLSERELRELLHRRNYVLRYLDRLVEDQGYGATVIE